MPFCPVNRILKFINGLIALSLLVAAAGVYWFAYRVLPQTSGSLALNVSAAATVTRNGLGVPHIKAASIEDAIYLHGYVTAQDRLFQMEATRRFAAGELSEVLGRATLEQDLRARRLRMRRIAEMHAERLRPEQKQIFAAYARGVNDFILTHRKSLPVEFALLQYEPRLWTIADSIVIALEMFRTLSESSEAEIKRRALFETGDAEKLRQLYPVRGGGEVQLGSNAWVVSGAHTASGKPLLANDPHLSFSFPSTWHQIHLEAPGLHAAGVTFPGLPGVVLGHNERIAWGVTNLHFDVMDLYEEKLDAGSGRYEFQGRVEQGRFERDVLRIKGEKQMDFGQWVTRHGPVIANENGRAISLRWIAAEPGAFDYVFADLNRAQNWSEFRTVLARHPGPAQNFVYADRDGHIGYQATGRLPIRPNYTGDLPVSGAGEFEWQGFIPFEDLPSVYDPPSGIIVTANQNPFPANYRHPVTGLFSAPYRQREIDALLRAKKGWKAEDMLIVQKDVYSEFSHFLAQQVFAAYRARGQRNATLADAAALLEKWNGQMEKGQAAPLVVTLIYQQVRRAIADRAAPGKGSAYDPDIATAAIEKILRERPASWFSDYDSLLLRAFADAIEEGRRVHGQNVNNWDYGRYNALNLGHPVLSRIPYLGGYFRIGPVQMSGSATTIKQTTPRLGPSMRFVADLSNWDQSLNNIVTGQSGQPFSGHFTDQWDAYYVGRSFPLEFSRVTAKAVLTVTPEK